MDRAAVIDTLRGRLIERGPSVVCAYLFGSLARGQARATSDVDVGVLLRDPPASTLDNPAADIASDLERALGIPLDLIVLNRASPDLVHRVLRDGVLVHETDRSARIRFETRLRNEYFDVLPILNEYRRVATERRP